VVFEPAAQSHGHFLCKRCGKILDVDYTLRPSTLRKLAKKGGIQIEDASVMLRGTCADCAGRT
jgi:Fur family peroxide stress response transcriptional regulator